MTLETTDNRSSAMAFLRHAVARALPATPQERAAALWSFAYFFMLLAGYYVLRPLRDQMAITGGCATSSVAKVAVNSHGRLRMPPVITIWSRSGRST